MRGTMAEAKSALRIFLKNQAGVVIADLTVFLGESIELAMVVTGVASRSALVAANSNSAPAAVGQTVPTPKIRTMT